MGSPLIELLLLLWLSSLCTSTPAHTRQDMCTACTWCIRVHKIHLKNFEFGALVFRESHKFLQRGGHYSPESGASWAEQRQTMSNRQYNLRCRRPELACLCLIACRPCSTLVVKASAEHSTQSFLLQANQRGMDACHRCCQLRCPLSSSLHLYKFK